MHGLNRDSNTFPKRDLLSREPINKTKINTNLNGKRSGE